MRSAVGGPSTAGRQAQPPFLQSPRGPDGTDLIVGKGSSPPLGAGGARPGTGACRCWGFCARSVRGSHLVTGQRPFRYQAGRNLLARPGCCQVSVHSGPPLPEQLAFTISRGYRAADHYILRPSGQPAATAPAALTGGGYGELRGDAPRELRTRGNDDRGGRRGGPASTRPGDPRVRAALVAARRRQGGGDPA